MAKVFLSYRRADSAQVAGRIFDKLVACYGDGSVFKDVDSISLGVDFQSALDESIVRSDVVLVIIGTNWSVAQDAEGRRRLEDPSDFVRAEIERALAKEIRIIPLLVENAKMPDVHELPISLRPLALRNAAVIRTDPDFHRDMERVIRSIGDFTAEGSTGLVNGEAREVNRHPAIATRYQLRITVGPVAGRVFALDRAQMTIGRSGDCDLQLKEEPYCSRTHCALEWDASTEAFVLNAWHTTGAILNRIHVEGRATLAVGDRISIGTSEMIFEERN